MSTSAAAVGRAVAGISFNELLAYHETETARWRAWFEKQPAAVLDVAAGEQGTELANVRGLLFHSFVCEWAYAQILLGQSWDDWKKFDPSTLAGVFAVAEEAQAKLRQWADSADEEEANRICRLSVAEKDFSLSGSARKFFVHAIVHSIRHLAQLASALRAAGYKTDWQHDLALSDAVA